MYLKLAFLLVCLAGIDEAQKNPQLNIEHGLIKGEYLKSREGKIFSSFRGIPYARPPLGNLRFQAPVPPLPWANVLDATRSGNACPQYHLSLILMGNEDCLYLNVYTPQVSSNVTRLLPVMFFIHGGANKFGSGNYEEYDPAPLMDKEVVLVTINYRLGALGYLTTADEVVPGNNGLKDQNFALKWVKRNIETFGGDPNRITLFGQSVGGMSVQLHMLSPLSRDLIQYGISQSGTACTYAAVLEGDSRTKNTKQLARLLNCTVDSNRAMVACLRKIPALEIVKQQKNFPTWNRMPLRLFAPVIEPNHEGAFLTKNPIDAYKEGHAANIPYMNGITSEEGAFHVSGIFSNDRLVRELNDEFYEIAPKTLAYKGLTPNDDDVTKKVRQFYFEDRVIDNSSESRTAITRMYSDSWRILMGSDNSVVLHSTYTKKPVYYYLFGYRASASFSEIFGDPDYNYGVSHCDELLHLFRCGAVSNYTATNSDTKVADLLLTLWTNFAKTGDPNTPTSSLLNKWERFSAHDKSKMYYIENGAKAFMVDEPYLKHMQFWKELDIKTKGFLNNF